VQEEDQLALPSLADEDALAVDEEPSAGGFMFFDEFWLSHGLFVPKAQAYLRRGA
jgi:hypothetical protein